MIQTLAHEQHEMATETISLQQGLQDKGYEEWVGEMIGMREILRHFSNVSTNDVVGMRAPYLKPGRNTQYKVIIIMLTIYVYLFNISVNPTHHPIVPGGLGGIRPIITICTMHIRHHILNSCSIDSDYSVCHTDDITTRTARTQQLHISVIICGMCGIVDNHLFHFNDTMMRLHITSSLAKHLPVSTVQPAHNIQMQQDILCTCVMLINILDILLVVHAIHKL